MGVHEVSYWGQGIVDRKWSRTSEAEDIWILLQIYFISPLRTLNVSLSWFISDAVRRSIYMRAWEWIIRLWATCWSNAESFLCFPSESISCNIKSILNSLETRRLLFVPSVICLKTYFIRPTPKLWPLRYRHLFSDRLNVVMTFLTSKKMMTVELSVACFVLCWTEVRKWIFKCSASDIIPGVPIFVNLLICFNCL
jgi:hypothetical protein